MSKFLIIVFVVFAQSIFVFSQAPVENSSNPKTLDWPNNRIGLSASMFTGFGLTYQYHFADKFAARLSCVAFGETNSGQNYYSNQNLYATVGADVQMNFHKTKYTRLFGFVGGSFWYDDYSSNNYWSEFENYTTTNINRAWVAGFGFGFEFLVWKIISFNIETGYMVRFGTDTRYEQSPTSRTTTITHPRMYGFGIGGGISYAF